MVLECRPIQPLVKIGMSIAVEYFLIEDNGAISRSRNNNGLKLHVPGSVSFGFSRASFVCKQELYNFEPEKSEEAPSKFRLRTLCSRYTTSQLAVLEASTLSNLTVMKG